MGNLHVGIVLDGNRRYAKRLMAQSWKGHEEGARRVEELLDWFKELDIKQLTLYCFSMENFRRPKEEVRFLMGLFKKEFQKMENDERIYNDRVKIRFIGQKELLDKELRGIMSRIEEKTKNYGNHILNFAIAYGGRQEILYAVKKLTACEREVEINEENFRHCLLLQDYPDLIIRTGGEKRTSNFLPWQSAYSEWVFLDKMWPEFTKKDLESAVREFNCRERRFGK